MALRGLRVIELAGLAPAPFCGLILSDFGANVVRVDKPRSLDLDRLSRGKRSITLDLKTTEGKGVLRKLCCKSDVLIEPFRSGVMERIGLGPEVLHKDNPALIYARLTGFGQSGPYATMAGHDLNYLAVSGILSALGRANGPPTPPINLLADFAGGGLICSLGIVMALLERTRSSGQGQVVDTNMVEGAAYIGSFVYNSRDLLFPDTRGKNLLDSGKHFYDTYETADGKWMSVAALEPQFYAVLIDKLDLDEEITQADDPDEAKKVFAAKFKTKTQKEWQQIFDGTDACVVPVVELDDMLEHPHNVAQETFMTGPAHPYGPAPRPAPRLSRTPAQPCLTKPPIVIGQHTEEVLTEYGYSEEEVNNLLKSKIAFQTDSKAKL